MFEFLNNYMPQSGIACFFWTLGVIAFISYFVGLFFKDKVLFKFALRGDVVDDNRFLPTRATPQSAGWDVACAFEDHKSKTVLPGEYVKIPLGFRCIPASGYWFEMRPRSSSFTKKKLHALYGTVDYDYRHMCFFCAKYDGDEPLTLEFGEKIGQIIPVKTVNIEVEQIHNKRFDKFCAKEQNARKGGFGSTG